MEKFNYKTIMELGFKETECSDSVYESIHGYPYCIVNKKLSKEIYLDWEKETKHCYLVRLSNPKEGEIGNKVKVKNLEQLESIIDFFKNK